jgi:hypothetical protein
VDRLRVALLSSTLLFWAAPVCAAVVAIVRHPTPTPELTETLSSLHGELLSVGFEVKWIDRPAGRGPGRVDSRAWLEALAAEGGIDAVIDIVGDPELMAVDVWVIEDSPRRFEVWRVDLEPNTRNASERLAIRAIEVLRSTFLENEMATREQHGEPIAERATPTAPGKQNEQADGGEQGKQKRDKQAEQERDKQAGQAGQAGQAEQDRHREPTSRTEGPSLEAGAAVLTSLDGVGPAILPIARFDWAASPWLVVQAALAGLGSSPTIATPLGTARIAQQYGVLGGGYRFGPDQWLWPFLALSAGALRTSVEGQAESPWLGHAVDQWSLLLDAGLGAGLRLPGRYYLTLAAHVHMAEPYVTIYFVDRVVATSGRPNLALTLTVGAWL